MYENLVGGVFWYCYCEMVGDGFVDGEVFFGVVLGGVGGGFICIDYGFYYGW